MQIDTKQDLIGMRFGRLRVICRGEDYISPKGNKKVRWRCVCDCGNWVLAHGSDLIAGKEKSCGKCPKDSVTIRSDYTGKRFDHAVVVCRAPDTITPSGKHLVTWNLICDCGNPFTATSESLKRRKHVSCGCMRDYSGDNRWWNYAHGECHTRIYRIWADMKNRCSNPNDSAYQNYGGRGIGVCDQWKSYINFSQWAKNNGYADDLSLDRIDNDRDYCPDNCRWTTSKEQANNRRTNRRLSFRDETKTIAEWSEASGVEAGTISRRLKSGWSIERALTTPVRKQKNNKSTLLLVKEESNV